MPESSSRSSSPASAGDAPKPRVVSGSLRDRIAKFNNADAVPLVPVNPYVGNASMQSSYARGGLVGNRLPNLDPKTAGLAGSERRRTPSDVGRGMIGNRIPSSSGGGSFRGGIGIGAPPSTNSGRSNSPTESAASSSAPGSSSAAIDSASISTSRSSSPATSPDLQLPPQLLVSSLPHGIDAGAMTPSSTIAEAGEEVFERSMPSTPIATATAELPPPVHDLVPGNLTLAGGVTDTSVPSAPSLSSSIRSQYDSASDAEEQTNLRDVSGVSTPTGTPRQAHRDLDERSVAGISVASSTRSGGTEELDDQLKNLEIDSKDATDKAAENEATAPLMKERSVTPTLPGSQADGKVAPRPIPEPERAAKSNEGAAPEATTLSPPSAVAATDLEVGNKEANAEANNDSAEDISLDDHTPTAVSSTQEEIVKVGTAADFEPEEDAIKVGDHTPTEASTQEEKSLKESSPVDSTTEHPKSEDVVMANVLGNTEPEITEVLSDTQPAVEDVKDDGSDDHGRPRNSVDTLRPVRPTSTDSDSIMTTPIVVPSELRNSLDRERDMPNAKDRNATPQPRRQDEREETPMPMDFHQIPPPPPALDDTSDIVSLNGAEDESSSNVYDVSSNRSSMPPARASSELEFSYEEYADRLRETTAAPGTQETRPEVSALVNAGVSQEDEETRFPSVPTGNINVDDTSSAHRPLQVHVEPSPYGPIVKTPSTPPPTSTSHIIDLSRSPTQELNVNAPDLKVEAPSPQASEFDKTPTPDFPSVPTSALPEAQTPTGSVTSSRAPTPPKRTSSLQGRAFPAVPDEEHPYIGVHVSPHNTPQASFPSDFRSKSPTLSFHERQDSNRSTRAGTPTSGRLSVDSQGTPRKKRNSFTPRSPDLDDEDPGDFEPGEGWAVVTGSWEPWRTPPRNPVDSSKLGRGKR